MNICNVIMFNNIQEKYRNYVLTYLNLPLGVFIIRTRCSRQREVI